MNEPTCKEITSLIADYLNGSLSRVVAKQFERHLRECIDCVNFLATYRCTAAQTRSFEQEDIPPEVAKSMLEFLRKRAGKHRSR